MMTSGRYDNLLFESSTLSTGYISTAAATHMGYSDRRGVVPDFQQAKSVPGDSCPVRFTSMVTLRQKTIQKLGYDMVKIKRENPRVGERSTSLKRLFTSMVFHLRTAYLRRQVLRDFPETGIKTQAQTGAPSSRGDKWNKTSFTKSVLTSFWIKPMKPLAKENRWKIYYAFKVTEDS